MPHGRDKSFLADVDEFSKKYGCDEPTTMVGEFENAVMLGCVFEGRRHYLWGKMAHRFGFDNSQHLNLGIET